MSKWMLLLLIVPFVGCTTPEGELSKLNKSADKLNATAERIATALEAQVPTQVLPSPAEEELPCPPDHNGGHR